MIEWIERPPLFKMDQNLERPFGGEVIQEISLTSTFTRLRENMSSIWNDGRNPEAKGQLPLPKYHRWQSFCSRWGQKKYSGQNSDPPLAEFGAFHQRQRTDLPRWTKKYCEISKGIFRSRDPVSSKPLVLRDVAEDIQMHESTISRVYPQQICSLPPKESMKLKYFFNAGITSTQGETLASESVKKPCSAEIHRKRGSKKTLQRWRNWFQILEGMNIHIGSENGFEISGNDENSLLNERRKIV